MATDRRILVFSVGNAGATGPRAVTPQWPSSTVRLGVWSLRVLLYLGLFASIGGAFLYLGRGPAKTGEERVASSSERLPALLAAVLSVGWQGLDALAAPVGALADRAVWLQGLRTSYGMSAAVAVAALVLAWLSSRWKGPAGTGSLRNGLIRVGLALAASGHAGGGTAMADADERLRPCDRPCLLAWCARASVRDAAQRRSAQRADHEPLRGGDSSGHDGASDRRRDLAVIRLRSFAAFWTTPYGNILFCKLVAVGGLLVLAAANRLVFTPALAQGTKLRRRRFAQSIAAEGVLVLLILGLVAGWRFRRLHARTLLRPPPFPNRRRPDPPRFTSIPARGWPR